MFSRIMKNENERVELLIIPKLKMRHLDDARYALPTIDGFQVVRSLPLKVDPPCLRFCGLGVMRPHERIGAVVRLFWNANQAMSASKHLALQIIHAHVGDDA